MVHYHITTPMKQGDIWVVDVKELIGNSVVRRTTVNTNVAINFVKPLFIELPLKYKEMLEEKK